MISERIDNFIQSVVNVALEGYEFKVVRCGSTVNGLKIGSPDEFDYMVKLTSLYLPNSHHLFNRELRMTCTCHNNSQDSVCDFKRQLYQSGLVFVRIAESHAPSHYIVMAGSHHQRGPQFPRLVYHPRREQIRRRDSSLCRCATPGSFHSRVSEGWTRPSLTRQNLRRGQSSGGSSFTRPRSTANHRGRGREHSHCHTWTERIPNQSGH